MKKTIALILTVILILSSAATAFAELSSYTKSPTVQEVPLIKEIEIVGENDAQVEIIKNENGLIQFYTKDGSGPAVDDCIVSLKVTPFAEKSTINDIVCKVEDGTSASGEVSAEDRLVYARTNSANGTDGMGADNFGLWREIIDDAAAQNLDGAKDAQTKIKNKDIAIVSLFDVSVWCERPAEHNLSTHHCVHTVRITFGDDEMSALLNHYVSLIHFNRYGQWEYIPSKLYEDAVTKEDVIEFQIDCEDLSPFAIAAYSSDIEGAPTSPQTGYDFPVAWVCAGVAMVAAAVIVWMKRKQA